MNKYIPQTHGAGGWSVLSPGPLYSERQKRDRNTQTRLGHQGDLVFARYAWLLGSSSQGCSWVCAEFLDRGVKNSSTTRAGMRNGGTGDIAEDIVASRRRETDSEFGFPWDSKSICKPRIRILGRPSRQYQSCGNKIYGYCALRAEALRPRDRVFNDSVRVRGPKSEGQFVWILSVTLRRPWRRVWLWNIDCLRRGVVLTASPVKSKQLRLEGRRLRIK